jgi:hypothetical protein
LRGRNLGEKLVRRREPKQWRNGIDMRRIEQGIELARTSF